MWIHVLFWQKYWGLVCVSHSLKWSVFVRFCVQSDLKTLASLFSVGKENRAFPVMVRSCVARKLRGQLYVISNPLCVLLIKLTDNKNIKICQWEQLNHEFMRQKRDLTSWDCRSSVPSPNTCWLWSQEVEMKLFSCCSGVLVWTDVCTKTTHIVFTY